jgi:hypothetical protein
MNARILLATLALLLAAPAGVIAQESMWSRVVNMDTAGDWTVMPERPRPQVVESGGQPFPQALRVRATQLANQWDKQATSPTGGDIAQGDTVMVMVLARAEQPAEGGSRLPARLQLTSAPYTGLIDVTFNITGEWKAYCMSGVAQQAFPESGSNVALHLATANHTLDIGPVFVFNFGQNYELSRLPPCPESLS